MSAGGLYRFNVRANDGVRVSVDGDWIIDEWHLNNGRNTYQVEMRLTGTHQIVVEYFEAGSGARIDVRWARAETNPTPTFTPTKIPRATATVTAPPPATPTTVPAITPTPVAQPGLVIEGRVDIE